jgi:hypothetical protein
VWQGYWAQKIAEQTKLVSLRVFRTVLFRSQIIGQYESVIMFVYLKNNLKLLATV